MTIRWTHEAQIDLDLIYTFIAEDSPRSAGRVEDSIFEAAESLGDLPEWGRLGRVHGSRELVLTPTPYILVYSISEDGVSILRVLHASRMWPAADRNTV